ncbi:MAG: AIR synthase-related protein, partial [Acidimicrobiales bacterium]
MVGSGSDILGGVGTARDFAIVVGPGRVDSGPDGPAEKAKLFGVRADQMVAYRVVHLRGDLERDQIEKLAADLLVDPVGQWWMYREEHIPPSGHGRVTTIETGLRPGVTDREGAELMRAARELDLPLEAATVATRWLIYGFLTDNHVDLLANRVLHNPVIERWALDELAPAHADLSATPVPTATIPVGDLDHAGLTALSQARRLGLTGDEMIAIQKWFASEGREPTDGELETLAQTWSEHCSHKTFRALINTPDGPIDGLLDTYLRQATDTIDAPWVESAFVDNAGIVNFDDTYDLALKAETHNHPSALEPFGGANTGVGGVVRDILGVSARPIAITDVLCFGPEDLPVEDLPDGVLHPRRVRSGVIAGVGDYGNKIGVPNLAGAIFHDPSYTTTPLVFAGCVGVLPRGSNPTTPVAGDFVVVLGGAVGRDGVGGATFSSQSMGAETAEVAGSSVQIGDPVIEKGLIDLVVAARDAGLYNAITDCGAGGLSSAVGEMAEELGAQVDLAKVPRKYPGLSPWEVWLSEAQERMVLAVPDPVPLLALAEQWQVEATVIGWFTGEGRLAVMNGEEVVIDLDAGFLHDGRPRLQLESATVDNSRQPRHPVELVGDEMDPIDALKALLAHPSLRSNEEVIRTYDHEVLGGTIVRPYDGIEMDGPADGTVLIPPGSDDNDPLRGVAIGIGSAIVIGRHD